MGKTSVKFIAYTKDQLSAIIHSRVQNLEVFAKNAIEQCAKMISNNGGDARKALDACKRALDLCTGPKVMMGEMHQALMQISATQANSILSQLSTYQNIFIAAVLIHLKTSTRVVFRLRDVAERIMQLITAAKLEELEKFEIIPVANQLIALNVIKGSKEGPINASSLMSLVAYDEDLLIYLSKCPYLKDHIPKRADS
jgi:origin recognition complex subunit 1